MGKSGEERTIVIVGGVAGGASAAARARRCNENARIIMFERDPHVSFANCGLPYYIGGEIDQRDKLLIGRPELFRRRFNIEVHTRHEVTEIDRERRVVKVHDLEAGQTREESYDRLILAPGASPITPPIPGVDAGNVFVLRNLEDMDRIAACITERPVRRAVVVGAGFIGLEMVEQLHARNIEVALVELAPQVLGPLDAEMAHLIQAELEAKNIELHLGAGLEALDVSDASESSGAIATAVRLSDGQVIETDMVVLGIGVRPNTGLAKAAGLDIGEGGGIAVNEFMQTSDPAIYAAGDAVEYMHGVLGKPMRVALGGPANRAGRIAGQHAAADSAPAMRPVLGTSIVRVFGKTAAMTGLGMKLARRLGIPCSAVIITAGDHAGYYPGAEPMQLKLIYDPGDGKILGAQVVGGAGVDKRIDVIATAISFGGSVRDLAGVDLSYAPPFSSAKDPVHMAAFAASNDLDGLSPMMDIDADLDGAQIVDVRTEAEVARFALPGAIHIVVEDLRERLGELDPDRPTVTVCHSGLRAHVAARILMQHGFGNVRNLTGGMLMRQHARPDEIVWGE